MSWPLYVLQLSSVEKQFLHPIQIVATGRYIIEILSMFVSHEVIIWFLYSIFFLVFPLYLWNYLLQLSHSCVFFFFISKVTLSTNSCHGVKLKILHFLNNYSSSFWPIHRNILPSPIFIAQSIHSLLLILQYKCFQL